MSKQSAHEVFCDASYFDQWCVRPIGEKRFGAGFHLPSQAEAEGLRELLDAATEQAERDAAEIERLTGALATARNDALEEAAKGVRIAGAHQLWGGTYGKLMGGDDAEIHRLEPFMLQYCARIASGILALKGGDA